MPSQPFQVSYHRTKLLPFHEYALEYVSTDEDDKANGYNPYHLDSVQLYNPIYSLFFKMDDSHAFPCISLNHRYSMIRPNTVIDTETGVEIDKPIFSKFSPLLDPFRYLIGKYKLTDPSLRIMPSLTNKSECMPKIADTNNVSYIDSFFSFLSSKLMHAHQMIHGIDFYGSFLGVQRVFKLEISDDIDYLNGSSFFINHLNDEFTIGSPFHDDLGNYGSRKHKQRIHIDSKRNITESSVISLGAEEIDVLYPTDPGMVSDSSEMIYEKGATTVATPSSQDDSERSSDSDSDLNYSSDEDNGDTSDTENPRQENSTSEHDSDESSEWTEATSDSETTPVYAYIKNFPVQMICLEKCENTLDSLFENGEVDEEHGSAYLMQIVMTLLIYQKAFRMTHNDLHTNNIMYVSTPFDYIYYVYQSKYYRVPTYGKIMKIIDFGRSIYTYRGTLFCSDSFAPGGDADTQYNSEPHYDDSKPRIDPNPSFDLCRLGCSIYDFVIDEEGETNPDSLDPFQKTIVRWCLDDNRKNVLYKKNGDERYPNFKLYKMIARNVHKHTPQSQLKYPIFKQYEIPPEKVDETMAVMKQSYYSMIHLDEIPDYTR
jgi:hypothetical protein